MKEASPHAAKRTSRTKKAKAAAPRDSTLGGAARRDLSDPALLDLVENGKVALPFEIVLRLAAVLGVTIPFPS